MTDATDRDEDDVALAGEFALRLMDAEARRAFARRMEREPALRALVRDWEERLATLVDEVPPVTPSPRVKARIKAQLFGTPPLRAGRGGAGPASSAAR
jgi:anti-sigma-K factor RskA